jgi:hypothetical protein
VGCGALACEEGQTTQRAFDAGSDARLVTCLRQAKGSVVRGYLKFRANIPPRWIKNARGSMTLHEVCGIRM